MTQVSAIDSTQMNSRYNAVKIQINNPLASIPDNIDEKNKGEYNAINIEVNKPELETKKSVYEYKKADEIVTADKAGIEKVNVPNLPVDMSAYKTSDTLANESAEDNSYNRVPEPYVTTIDNEKKLNFHGLNFKAANANIQLAANIKPSVDIEKITNNLNSKDFNVQAKQMEEIIANTLENNNNAIPFITTPVFSSLITILNTDTEGLEGPSEKQTEIRTKFVINEITREKGIAEGKNESDIELPYELSEEDLNIAEKMTPLELAERNKEYSLFALASLTKVYADEYKNQTGNTIPLTDLPGVSNIVEIIKNEKNQSIRAAAIDTLLFLKRDEYNEELKSVFEIAANDKNQMVAAHAIEALQFINQ